MMKTRFFVLSLVLAALPFLTGCGGNALHKLMIETQPGNLQTCLKKTMGSVQRDEQRAKYLNEHLPELIITEEDGTED